MKNFNPLLLALLVCNLIETVTAQQAAPVGGTVRYEALPSGSEMVMTGTSTLHDWDMKSVILNGFIEADVKFPESALSDKAAHPKAQVSVPVRSFKSNSKALDEGMQKTMKEPQFKRIEYRLIALKPKSATGATGALQFDATGALTIAGKAQTNTMPVTIEKLEGNKLKVTGATTVKMTDFGITPPSFLAALKTGDDVKLTFTWLAGAKSP